MPEFALLQPQPQVPADVPEVGGTLYFHRPDISGSVQHRVVALKELAYLPLDAREDPDVLGKQWAALRGLYQGDVDFIYVAAGFYQPQHIGLVQFYGTSAEGPDPKSALLTCHNHMRAVEAVLSNFVLSRLESPTPERMAGLTERIRALPSLLALLGHPDPRLTRRGLGTGPAGHGRDEDLASQQGEILMRGLAKLREDFVFLVTAQHVARELLHQALVRMSRVSSQYASRQRGSLNVGFSVAMPLAAALSQSMQGTSGLTGGNSDSQSQSWGEGTSTTQGVSEGSSQGTSDTQSQSHMEGTSTTQGQSNSWSQATGVSESQSLSAGGSETHSQGDSQGQSRTETSTSGTGTSQQYGTATGHTASHGTSQGQTQTAGSTWSTAAGNSQSNSQTQGYTQSVGETVGTGQSSALGNSSSVAAQSSTSLGQQTSANGSLGLSAFGIQAGVGGTTGVTAAESVGQTQTQGSTQTDAESSTHQQSQVHGSSHSQTTGQGTSWTQTQGSNTSQAHSSTQQQGYSQSHTQTQGYGQSRSASQALSAGQNWATSQSATQGTSWQQGASTTVSQTVGEARGMSLAVGESQAQTTAVAHSSTRQWQQGSSQSWAQQISTQQGQQQSTSSGWSTGLGRGFTGGFSSGLVPGLHIGRGWQTEDDTALRLTEVTRQLTTLLDRASIEGAFMTTALLFTGLGGQEAAAALVPQAFHGPDVPTPVLTRPGDADLRALALTFQPSLLPVPNPFDIDVLWTRWSTLLTPSMLAAYTAPNLFEEGAALTFQEKMPPLAFYPELAGETICGYQVSPETGDLTPVPLRLSQQRHFHTVFCGDTGFGKSVAAERMVYDTTRHWHLRTVVLDFGTGWRKLLNAPGLEGHVEIRQLSPGGVRPLRWNPLQIGRHILPEVQWRTFCDVFGQIAQLGQRRQIHELRDALRRLYLGAGVLVDDPEVGLDDTWGVVRFAEADLVEPVPGTPLSELSPEQRQLLAIERSRAVGLHELYIHIKETLAARGRKDMMLRTVLEGILFRLHPLVQGAASLQYRAGPDCVDINEVVSGEWGVAVLEGGSFLDDFSKAFLLGWAAWHFYHDAVSQRLQRAVSAPAHIQIVFEEANKILSGLEHSGEGGGQSVAEQFEAMWRDSRKYGIWLHLISQTPSSIPPGILSSCNNIFISQLKNPRDRDLMLAALHRSEKGFVDETWRRFLASMPVGRSVVKLGYSFDRGEVEPTYIQPLMLDIPEPTDTEIPARLGAVVLTPETDEGRAL